MSDVSEDGYPVKLPSGTVWPVQSAEEARFARDKVKAYLSQFKFANVSDLSGLDQVIQGEVLIHRMNTELSLGRDNFNGTIADMNTLKMRLKDASAELRMLKASLRLDRNSRSQDDQADTVNYISDLNRRALAFGYMRDAQTAKAIDLMKQTFGLCEMHRNTHGNEQEQKEMKCTPEAIVQWLDTEAREEFNAIDKHFREENKIMWWIKPGEGL
jgi:hypothetical protein